MKISKEVNLEDSLHAIQAIYVFLVSLEADLKNIKIKNECEHYRAGCRAGMSFVINHTKTVLHVLGYDIDESIYDESKQVLEGADKILNEKKNEQ